MNDVRTILIVAILSIAGTAAVTMNWGEHRGGRNPPGCECSPECNCPECHCGDHGLDGRSPAVQQWPAGATNFRNIGGGWWIFDADVGGRSRTFLSGRTGLIELDNVPPGSPTPGRPPGSAGAPPAAPAPVTK